MEAICRLDYLVMGHMVSIFTDHANLVYLSDPYGRNPGILVSPRASSGAGVLSSEHSATFSNTCPVSATSEQTC